MNGAESIAVERLRQRTEKGWTEEHDDSHAPGVLVTAGAGYITTARAQIVTNVQHFGPEAFTKSYQVPADFMPEAWPFAPEWFKPSADPLRNMQKGAALVAAEMDKLARAHGWTWGGMTSREALQAIANDSRITLPPDVAAMISEVLAEPNLGT